MQRDNQSNRSKKWRIRNSLNNQGCIDYVTELCYSYGIEKYHVESFIGDAPALFIECKDNIVILALEPNDMRLQVYKRANNDSNDIPTMHFENDSCWKKGIEWAAKTTLSSNKLERIVKNHR